MTLSGTTYHCSAGETFDSVALEVYGDENLACELLCANPAYTLRTQFTGGEILALPVVDLPEDEETGTGTLVSVTAPWKE